MDVAASQALEPDRKRLHITPFNPDLLDRFIPLSLRPLASGVSFHTVQTYPERGFGYVELPAMEADKLKKKFNGSVLKGSKVKIENAKPEKKRKVEVEVEEDGDARKERKRAKKEKRRREEGVLPGRELEEGRHIKRGWKDEAADKVGKKSVKAKSGNKDSVSSLEGKKMRFKTTIPPNAAPMEKTLKSKSKDKKEKEDRVAKHSAVVQEFAKAQKPAPSVGKSKSKRAVSFEDGQGWVDEEGNVVETASKSKRPRKERLTALVETDQAKDASEGAENATAPKTAPVQPPADPTPEPILTASVTVATDDESSSLSSSSEEPSSEDDQSESDDDLEGEEADLDHTQSSPVRVGTFNERISSHSPDAEDSAIAVESPAKEVHPLEALFKRPRPVKSPESIRKPKPQPIDTSFSFFNSSGADEDMDVEEDGSADYPPQTPHTKQDMEWRGMRSAAPTPDTAAIGRKFSFPFARGDESDIDEDENEDVDVDAGVEAEDEDLPDANQVPVTGTKQGQEREESEFRKWFFENRGDLNRGWKKRRREERKAKRQRENRRLSRRVV